MAKIVKEGVHVYTFRALYKVAELCQLEMVDSGGEVPRDWKSLGSELWCQLPYARRALSHLDREIKMSVKDVILYLTLCCPAWLLQKGINSRVKPLQSVLWLPLLREHG